MRAWLRNSPRRMRGQIARTSPPESYTLCVHPTPSDIELLDAWAAGDAQSGNTLVKRHLASVYGYFRNKLGGEIEDIIQRTFLGCVEALPRFRRESSFRTFLFAVAHKQLLMALRSQNSGRSSDTLNDTPIDELGIAGPNWTPSTQLAERRERVILLRAMRRLPLADQCALELFYWEGMSGAKIAQALELPHATVRTRLRRARQRLGEIVNELAESASLATSTMQGFDTWMEGIAEKLAHS